jgi:hypothetical protein
MFADDDEYLPDDEDDDFDAWDSGDYDEDNEVLDFEGDIDDMTGNPDLDVEELP